MLRYQVVIAPIIACKWQNGRGEDHADSAESLIAQFPNYPEVAPPFNQFWIEFTTDSDTLCGCLVAADRKADRFVYVASHFHGGKPSVLRFSEWRFSTDLHGRFMDGSFAGNDNRSPGHSMAATEYDHKSRTMAALTTGAILTVLGLLSCKNVSLRADDIDATEAKQIAKRHGGKPGDYRYHVLIVRPAGAGSDHPGMELDAMPFHACRGHFTEYGPEYGKGKLFGRLSGRFYIAPHMRGKRENGVVEKDYQLKEAS